MTRPAATGEDRYVGRRVLRTNDAALLRGDALFTDDLRAQNLRHAVIIRSSVAHGRVVGFDASAALAVPGVTGVLVPHDVIDATGPLPCAWVLPGQRHGSYPVVDMAVRYVGQPLGIVVADSVAIALDALELVQVDYDVLPVVLDAELATTAGSASLYADIPSNLALDLRVGTASEDVDRVIAGAAHVVAGRFVVQRQTGAPLEPRGVLASPDRATGVLTVWSSTQVPHHVREDLASVLHVPVTKVRVIAPAVGGGFGPKDHLYPDEVLVCLASLRFGTAVKWIEQRTEHLQATAHARDQVQFGRLALDAHGRFLALDARIVVDLGAHCTNVGGGPAFTTAALLEGPYRFDAAGSTIHGVLTNKTPTGAYRGFGQGEAAWLRERLIDLAAERVGLSPVEIRRRNMIRSDEMPFMTHGGQSYDSGDYTAALERAHELIGAPTTAIQDGRVRGVGLASYVQFAGSATVVERNINFRVAGYETVVLRMEADGAVTLHTGVCPHGQGLETTLAQVAADELGVPMDAVSIVFADTATTPYSAGTIASRSMMLGGGAVIGAAVALRAKILAIAAHRLEAAAEDLQIRDGSVVVTGSPTSALTLGDLAHHAWLGWDLPPGCEAGLEVRHVFDPVDCAYSYATHAAAVAVDPETGAVEVERYVVVQDCGTIVNPMIVEGQIHGAVAQGIGGALLEKLQYDDHGQLLTSTFIDYALPSACEMPPIVIEHLEHPSPRIPGGMKGMAEGGVVPCAPAIANALAATMPALAHLVTETPMAPETVWRWMQTAR